MYFDALKSTFVLFNDKNVVGQRLIKIVDFIDADILINPNSPGLPVIECGNKIGIVDEFSQPTKELRKELQKKMNWELTATEYYSKCGFNIQTDIVLNSGLLIMQPKIHGNFLKNIYRI